MPRKYKYKVSYTSRKTQKGLLKDRKRQPSKRDKIAEKKYKRTAKHLKKGHCFLHNEMPREPTLWGDSLCSVVASGPEGVGGTHGPWGSKLIQPFWRVLSTEMSSAQAFGSGGYLARNLSLSYTHTLKSDKYKTVCCSKPPGKCKPPR